MDEQNPYRSPSAAIVEPAGEELASPWARLGAAILDVIIYLVVMFPLMFLGGYWQAVMNSAQASESAPIGLMLMWAVIGFVVFFAIHGYPLNATGQTWGKRIAGVKIVDLSGAKPSLARIIGLRYVPIGILSSIPFVGMIIGLIDVLLIFRADRRCGHDLIAGTKVVQAK